MQESIKLAIIEDHPLYVNGLISLLGAYQDVKVVATGLNISDGMVILKNTQPDILFLDIDLPDGKGIQLLEFIKKENLPTKTIILSMYHDYIHMQLAEERGAFGYLPKNADPDKLILAIRTVFNGGSYFEKTESKLQVINEKISRREKEVLELLSEGKSRELIADILCISPDTLKSHIKNLVLKTNANNINELVTGYLQSKI